MTRLAWFAVGFVAGAIALLLTGLWLGLEQRTAVADCDHVDGCAADCPIYTGRA